MCENLDLLRTIYLIKNIFEITLLIAPILLIIMASVDLGKIVIGGDNVEKKMVSSISKRMIAAVVIFFVPTAVSVLLNMVSEAGVESLSCWEEATQSNIDRLTAARAIEEEARRQEEEERRREAEEEARRQAIAEQNNNVVVVEANHNGDVNLDGVVNDDDLTMLEAYVSDNGSVTLTPTQMSVTAIRAIFSPQQLVAADVNGSRTVDSIDVSILSSHLSGTQGFRDLPIYIYPGDVNMDGIISTADYLKLGPLILNNCSGCTQELKRVADVYKDNIIDANDGEVLKKHINGVEGYHILPITPQVNVLPIDVLPGDVNMDGIISTADVMLMRDLAANNCSVCTQEVKNAADVYKDGIIDENDYEVLSKHFQSVEGYQSLPIIPQVEEQEPEQEQNVPPNIPLSPSGSYSPFVKGVQKRWPEKVEANECLSFDDNCYCPTVGRFLGFKFTMEDGIKRNFDLVERYDTMVTVSVPCSGDLPARAITAKVNTLVADNYKKAFEKLCQLATTGIDGVKIDPNMVQWGGDLVVRLNSARTVCSPHAYGTAIDYNYDLNISVGNETFKPYNGQGTETKETYDAFVAALGREDDPRNVNYIMRKYAFTIDNGFTWGGEWQASSFDPMHFEVR